MNKSSTISAFLMLSFIAVAWCSAESGAWVALESDSRDAVRRIVAAEVNKRDDFSTPTEERKAMQEVEKEKSVDEVAYKKGIVTATTQFNKTRKNREELVEKYQGRAKELEELHKSIQSLKTGVASCDNQTGRARQEMVNQREALKMWLKSEKLGEAVAAVIYTRGFKDTVHDLDALADQVSAPLMAEQMGVSIKSSTMVINRILAEDYITATTEGSAKSLAEAPLRLELDKSPKGTVYLRLKRYELFPFQDPHTGKIKGGNGSSRMKVAAVSSDTDLELFLSSNGYQPASLDLSQARALLADAAQASRHGNEGVSDQVTSFEEKIRQQQERLKSIAVERELQSAQLLQKETQYTRLQGELEQLKTRKEAAEKEFAVAQTALNEKKRLRQAIVTKTALAVPKGGESPADAIAAMIIDKLEEVKNDAKTQHATATTTVVNGMHSDDTASQSVTEARIAGLRLISFINEGDSVKVKMAFRVETVLNDAPERIRIDSTASFVAKTRINACSVAYYVGLNEIAKTMGMLAYELVEGVKESAPLSNFSEFGKFTHITDLDTENDYLKFKSEFPFGPLTIASFIHSEKGLPIRDELYVGMLDKDKVLTGIIAVNLLTSAIQGAIPDDLARIFEKNGISAQLTNVEVGNVLFDAQKGNCSVSLSYVPDGQVNKDALGKFLKEQTLAKYKIRAKVTLMHSPTLSSRHAR